MKIVPYQATFALSTTERWRRSSAWQTVAAGIPY